MSFAAGASAAWRNILKVLAETFESPAISTRTPRKDAENFLTLLKQQFAALREAKNQAYKDLALIKSENVELRSLVSELEARLARRKPAWYSQAAKSFPNEPRVS